MMPKFKKSSFFYLYLFFAIFIANFIIQSAHASSDHITYVLITVDTEGPSPDVNSWPYYGKCLLPDQIQATAQGTGCGVSQMMHIADKYDFKISFFLDVMEEKLFGEKKMKEIADFILSKGHDIQLHIDSLYLVDQAKHYQYQYSLEEQKKIISYGHDTLRRWTGKKPIAHRAGAYAANQDTLTALNDTGFPVDSSYYYNNNRCRLQDLYATQNAVSDKYGIIQIPVTIFTVLEYAEIAGSKLKPVSRNKKVDIDSCDFHMIKATLEQAAENNLDTVVLFLHSFSFIKFWSDNSEERKADTTDIKEFDDVLNFIHNHDQLTVVSVDEWYQLLQKGDLTLSYHDFVPSYPMRTSLVNYARRLVGINRKNVKLWLAGMALGCILVVFFSALAYKRKTKKTKCYQL